MSNLNTKHTWLVSEKEIVNYKPVAMMRNKHILIFFRAAVEFFIFNI